MNTHRRRLQGQGDAARCHASEKDQRRELERALGRDLGDFTLGPASAENTNALTREFVQQYGVSVPQYARSEGTLMLVRPRVLGSDSFAIDRKIRTYPFELGRDTHGQG